MAEVTYTPGGAEAWRVAVSGGTVAVLPPEVTARTAEAVWRRLDGGGIGALIEALTGAFGTSLTAIPPFALVTVEDDGVRAAVRGATEIIVETDAETVAVTSAGAATWAERHVTGVRRLSIALAGEADAAGALPLASGVVPATGITLTVAARPARPAASDRPAPVEPSPPARAVEPSPPPPVEPSPVPPVEPFPVPPVEPSPPAPVEPAPPATPESPPVPETAPVPETPPVPEPASAETLAPETIRPDMLGSDAGDGGGLFEPVPAGPAPVADEFPAATAGDWASTILRGVPPLPATPPAASSPADAADWAVQGDHDGATISVAEARRLRAQSGAAGFAPVADVPARTPATGRVRLSTGRVVELERTVVVGRRPRSTRASGEDLPTLVAVESPQHDISRNHVEIRAEGEHVIVTDLATTNGTVLLRSGSEPVRLHPGEPTMVVDGDVLDIGDGVTLAFEDLP